MRARAGCLLLLAAACSDPAFVSLGRNVQSVASTPDAGVVDAPMMAPATLACAGAAPSGSSSNASEVSFGCEIESLPVPTPPEPVCALAPEQTAVDTPCEQRQPLTCPASGSELERLRRMLFDVIGRCTDLAYQVTATFQAGCATAFSMEALELPSSAVRDCIAARLEAERYDCAQTVDCAVGSTYPLPTR